MYNDFVHDPIELQRFYTVQSAGNSTGLGLSIARLLTERMKGDITAWYKAGQLDIQITLKERMETIENLST